eukprot:8839109-Alexandrium_andersonii.AAC.1
MPLCGSDLDLPGPVGWQWEIRHWGWRRPFAGGWRPPQRARPSCRPLVRPGALPAGAGVADRWAPGGQAAA